MTRSRTVVVSGAVEGLVDEAILRRLLVRAGAKPGVIVGKHGKSFLKTRMDGFNEAAQVDPWVVLVDLDHDAECPSLVVDEWVPEPAPHMCFRIAVRAIESWLIADSTGLAEFLSVTASRIPRDPDALSDPKRTMLKIAASSRRKTIRADMVPRPRSQRKVGPAYNSRLIEFVNDKRHGWKPAVAARSSDSLKRCLLRLDQLIKECV